MDAYQAITLTCLARTHGILAIVKIIGLQHLHLVILGKVSGKSVFVKKIALFFQIHLVHLQ